jgi:hypothetical protein
MAIAPGELMELRTEAGGLRYYLSGKPILASDALELLLDNGTWALGHYQWNCRPDDWPCLFYLDIEKRRPTGRATGLNPDKAVLRWPEGPQ